MPRYFLGPEDQHCVRCGAVLGLFIGLRGIATLCAPCRDDLRDWAQSFGEPGMDRLDIPDSEQRFERKLRDLARAAGLTPIDERTVPA